MQIEYVYLGIFRQFIPIRSFIDKININAIYKDIINIIERNSVLEEDYYAYYEIELEKPSNLIIEINSNSDLDVEVYIFDEELFNRWQEYFNGSNINGKLTYFPDLHFIVNNNFNETIVLDEGRHYLVIENMDIGDVYPPMNLINDKYSYKIKLSKKEI